MDSLDYKIKCPDGKSWLPDEESKWIVLDTEFHDVSPEYKIKFPDS